MKPFRRRGDELTARLSDHEVTLITSLCAQLLSLLAEIPGYAVPQDPAADSFALWEAELDAGTHMRLPDDPALQRLFPAAYGDDDTAAQEFRRSTMPRLREEKYDQLGVVMDDLEATQDGQHRLLVPLDHVDAWLKTLTNLRLSIAVRIGITDAASERAMRRLRGDDPRAYPYSVYQWLNFTQESLLEALNG